VSGETSKRASCSNAVRDVCFCWLMKRFSSKSPGWQTDRKRNPNRRSRDDLTKKRETAPLFAGSPVSHIQTCSPVGRNDFDRSLMWLCLGRDFLLCGWHLQYGRVLALG
jgi:hypothetical protein